MLANQVQKKSEKKKSRAPFYCELLQVTLLPQDLRVFTKGVDSKNLPDIFTYDSYMFFYFRASLTFNNTNEIPSKSTKIMP